MSVQEGIIAVSLAVLLLVFYTHRTRPKPLLVRSFMTFSAGLWALCAYIVLLRYGKGLGMVSAMSDQFPWGLWIGFDVMCGVALSAGGFVIAGTVHLFHIRRFEPILRATVLTAFLGYLLVIVALLLDLGRPYRIWHPVIMWQHHSMLFEVAWCVMLYTTVLALEFAPVVLEKFKMNEALRTFRMFTIPIVLAGVLLSSMHQSSLGSMFLIVPEKLYPLWYSPFLPVFFIISAVAAGLCMVIVESSLSSYFLSRSLEVDLLSRLAKAASYVLLFYAAFRAGDLYARKAWGAYFTWSMESVSFTFEMAAGVLLPALLLMMKRVRKEPRWLFVSALLVVGGVILNRLNVSWVGILRYSNFAYIPSWMEVTVTLGLIAAGIFVFGFAARFFPTFEEEQASVPMHRSLKLSPKANCLKKDSNLLSQEMDHSMDIDIIRKDG